MPHTTTTRRSPHLVSPLNRKKNQCVVDMEDGYKPFRTWDTSQVKVNVFELYGFSMKGSETTLLQYLCNGQSRLIRANGVVDLVFPQYVSVLPIRLDRSESRHHRGCRSKVSVVTYLDSRSSLPQLSGSTSYSRVVWSHKGPGRYSVLQPVVTSEVQTRGRHW